MTCLKTKTDNMANPITNKVKTGKIPVIKKELDSGVIAEANNDGTIYLDKDVKDGSPLAKEAIAHEMVHMDQMARGDLNYDDEHVYWKGKEYDRDDMNEGSDDLPWEAEAYQKTQNMKKSSPNKMNFGLSSRTLRQRAGILSDQLAAKADKHAAIGAQVGKVAGYLDNTAKFGKKADVGKNETDNTEVVENTESNGNPMNLKNKNKSAMKMMANPITMKAKSSPLHVETTSTREFRGNIEGGGAGTFTETKIDKEEKKMKPAAKEFAENCGTKANPKAKSFVNSQGKTVACKWKDDKDYKEEDDYDIEVKSDLKTTFKPDKTQDENPGTPDSYNMGYYESMDARYAQGVRRREGKQTVRQSGRSRNQYDRLYNRGYNEDGTEKDGNAARRARNKIGGMSKEDYVSARSGGEANFNQKIGTLKRGEPGSTGPERDADADENLETFVINESGGTDSVNNMNKKNKNKAPFKMKGFSGFNK